MKPEYCLKCNIKHEKPTGRKWCDICRPLVQKELNTNAVKKRWQNPDSRSPEYLEKVSIAVKKARKDFPQSDESKRKQSISSYLAQLRFKQRDPELYRKQKAKAGRSREILKDIKYNSRGKKCFYQGRFGEILTKSKLELDFILMAEEAEWIHTLLYETIKIPYRDHENTERLYYPDFLINGSHIVEIKPTVRLNDSKNICKANYAKSFCNEKGLYLHCVDSKQFNSLILELLDYNGS